MLPFRDKLKTLAPDGNGTELQLDRIEVRSENGFILAVRDALRNISNNFDNFEYMNDQLIEMLQDAVSIL